LLLRTIHTPETLDISRYNNSGQTEPFDFLLWSLHVVMGVVVRDIQRVTPRIERRITEIKSMEA
jgi:hypothetical protein